MKWLIAFILFLSVNSAAFAETRTYDLCGVAGQPRDRHVASSSVTHVPRDNVNMNSNAILVPDPIDIPLTIDLSDRLNIDLPAGTEMEAPIAFISVYKDGRILYDGRDLTQDVVSICQKDGDAFDDVLNTTAQ